jgi:flagellar motor switch protein FliG
VERIAGGLADDEGTPSAGAAPSDRPALDAASRLMRGLPHRYREAIIRKLPPELEEELLRALFSFDALPTLADREIQSVVRKADKRTLAISLLGAPEEHFHAVTSNMSRRAAEMLREDMESLLASGDLKTRDVHDARSALSSLVREVARHESESDQNQES